MQKLSLRWRCEGRCIGLVPTMGALHEGHLTLARRARAECDMMVASIFVNPLQFGVHEDLDKYPRPFERDCQLLREAGCDAIFAPDAAVMYGKSDPADPQTFVEVSMLGEMWEGVVRPGHLRGVATVVAKLFNIMQPQRAYFGEKDYQQLKVIEHMVEDLNFPIEIVPVPTVRESDGLALSSRNTYLAPAERAAAPVLHRAMCEGVQAAQDGETEVAAIGEAMARVFATEPDVAVQYVAIVDAQTLESLETLDGRPARILVAARVGHTRLIDNMAI